MMNELFIRENLEKFYRSYSQSCEAVLSLLKKEETNFEVDHLGCLFHDSKEFEEISKIILSYSSLIKEVVLNNRRVRVFKLKESLKGEYPLSKIEIFEPKPESDLSKLRYGIEHISFYVKNWEAFNTEGLSIAKKGEVGDSKFVKTEIINTIEIEFRSDRLGEEDTY